MAYKHCGISTAGCDDYACYCSCYRCSASAILEKEWKREEGHCQSQRTGCVCWDGSTCHCNCRACLLTGNSKHCGSYKCNAYGDLRGARACPCECDCLSCTYSKADLARKPTKPAEPSPASHYWVCEASTIACADCYLIRTPTMKFAEYDYSVILGPGAPYVGIRSTLPPNFDVKQCLGRPITYSDIRKALLLEEGRDPATAEPVPNSRFAFLDFGEED